MKVYTKTGDKGTTSLFGGTKVPKSDIRIEAYGTIDELNSVLGIIDKNVISPKYADQITQVQKDLFVLGSEYATPADKLYLANGKCRLGKLIENKNITQLENWIDEMDEELPQMTHFILPSGDRNAAYCHLARTVCRRAERIAFTLNEKEELRKETLIFINRLSDYLFTLARKINLDAKQEEIKWLPEQD